LFKCYLFNCLSLNAVGGATKGLLDIVGLLASKEYDLDSKQFMLQKILLKISGIQSRVHRLQERLRKAGSKQAKLASFMDHAEVNVAEKRQRTQKRSFSPENDRYARPQKKKQLNILLEQENGTALSVKPTLSERATDCVKEEPQWDSEEKTAERSHAHKKAITVDLLLGAESSLANGHLGDLCKEVSPCTLYISSLCRCLDLVQMWWIWLSSVVFKILVKKWK
jgi:hypothetical protein